jgi:hypothetical protein
MNISKWKLEERIKLSYLRNRGDELSVVEEFNDLGADYIKKIIKKIKKRQDRNVKELICNTLSQHILLGYESRVSYLRKALNNLDGMDIAYISVCCNFITEFCSGDYICLKCKSICKVGKVLGKDVSSIRNDLIKSLREEDELLINFMDKMKYNVDPEEYPKEIKKQQFNILYMNDKKSNNTNNVIDAEIVKEVDELSPMDKNKLIKKLEEKIINNVEGG